MIPGYNSHTKVVPSETGGMESVLKTIEEIFADEVFYGSKVIRGIRSGFICLHIREGNIWTGVNEYSDAHFVCALFADGSHIPLPLLIPSYEPKEVEPGWVLQARIINFATEAGLLNKAITACALQVIESGSSHNEAQLKLDASVWLDEHPGMAYGRCGGCSSCLDRPNDCPCLICRTMKQDPAGEIVCPMNETRREDLVECPHPFMRRDEGKTEMDCPWRDSNLSADMSCGPGCAGCRKGFDPDRREGDLISDIICWLDEPANEDERP